MRKHFQFQGNCSIFFLFAIGVMFLCSCSSQNSNDLPRYPNARYINSQSGKETVKGATVFYTSFESFDNYADIEKFFNEKLSKKQGWKIQNSRELSSWTDGNIQIERDLTSGKPKDPSKPGVCISIYKLEGKVFINEIKSVPTAK